MSERRDGRMEEGMEGGMEGWRVAGREDGVVSGRHTENHRKTDRKREREGVGIGSLGSCSSSAFSTTPELRLSFSLGREPLNSCCLQHWLISSQS